MARRAPRRSRICSATSSWPDCADRRRSAEAFALRERRPEGLRDVSGGTMAAVACGHVDRSGGALLAPDVTAGATGEPLVGGLGASQRVDCGVVTTRADCQRWRRFVRRVV